MDAMMRDFITRCSVACRMVGHPFPDMAACEAVLESKKPGVPFRLSQLAQVHNNLFGMKVHQHNDYGEAVMPTKEVIGGEWTVVNAHFESYQTLDDCFEDRLR